MSSLHWPNLLHSSWWPFTVQEGSSTLWEVLFWSGFLAICLTRKAWLGNWFNYWWPAHVAGSIRLHGSSSTHRVTWHKVKYHLKLNHDLVNHQHVEMIKILEKITTRSKIFVRSLGRYLSRPVCFEIHVNEY